MVSRRSTAALPLSRLRSEKVKLLIGTGKLSLVFRPIGRANNRPVGPVLNPIPVISLGTLTHPGARFVCSMPLEPVTILSVMFRRQVRGALVNRNTVLLGPNPIIPSNSGENRLSLLGQNLETK